MKNKCKKLGSALAVCMGTAVLGACGGTSSASGENLKIVFALNEMDTFRQTLADAAQETASSRGCSLELADAQGVVENQVNQIQKAVADGCDAIVCSPVDADTVTELKTSAGDLPVVFVNSRPQDKSLEKDKYMYAGSSEEVAGQYQAEYVLEQFASKDEIRVVILKGPANHSATKGRTKGVQKTLNESGKKISYVFVDNADWAEDKAEKMFDIFLKTGGEADCVICNNDSMALGVIRSCKKAGIDPASLLILGVDATADGCAAIQNGEMAFTVYQSGSGQGQAAVETAIAIASGSSTGDIEGITEDGKYVWVPFEKVDAGNVSKYIN